MSEDSNIEESTNENTSRLAWRIPLEGQGSAFRRGYLRLMMASVLCLLLLWFFGGEGVRVWGVVAVIVITLVSLVVLRIRTAPPAGPEDNVWLDSAGLHWVNEHGGQGTLDREKMDSYFLSLDPEAIRGRPSLIFRLQSGNESQPVPLARPYRPEQMRAFLSDQLKLAERPLQAEDWPLRLQSAIDAGLSAWSDDLPAELLRLSLLRPQPVQTRDWRVFRVADQGDIHWSAGSLTFTAYPDSGAPEELHGLSDVVEFVRENWLPPDASEMRKMRSELTGKLAEQQKHAITQDAERIGLLSDCDDANREWLFQGDRSALEQVAESLEDAAKRFEPPEPGERPSRLELGGYAMPLTIAVEEFSWQGGGVIAGPAHRLKDLAATIKERLTNTKDDDSFTVEPPNDASERWRLRFEISSPIAE